MPDSQNRRIVVNLEQPTPHSAQNSAGGRSVFNENGTGSRGRFSKILLILGGLLLLAIMVGGIGGLWWWSSLQKSPAYSLALLITAARKDDTKTIEQLLDTNSVVDTFVPQIADKARERYGRGLPPETVKRAEQMLQPLLPEIKNIASRDIPRIIKEKAESAPDVPPWAMATGIGRLADIQEKGDTAIVKADLQNRPLELTMQRRGDRWQVVGLKDEILADKIANEVAQTLLREANRKPGKAPRQIDQKMIEDLRKQIEGLVP
jgi:hypothetical protein